MTENQIKAAKSLKRALAKCRDNNLMICVFSDAGFYAVPLDALRDQGGFLGETNEEVHGNFEKYGYECAPIGLKFDGGAGV